MTCGVADEFASYVRHYVSSKVRTFDSKEWPILAYTRSFSHFSEPGDLDECACDRCSGPNGWHSVYCNGSGYSEKTAGTYAIPILTLLDDMEKNGWRRATANMASLQD